MKKIKFITIVSLLLALVLSTGIALAQTGSSTPKEKKNEAKKEAAVTRLIEKGDKAIEARVEALNKLKNRIQEMKLVSADNKASLASQLDNQIASLNTLKAKIDAATDLPTLKEDVKSITGSFRIFALMIPQGRIIAAADRLSTVIGDLTVVANKLQARIAEAQTAGKDVASLTAIMTDLNAKLVDAKTQAEAAVSHSIGLTPDNGDKTILASNKDALKLSHKDIQVGQQDIVAVRKDIEAIRKGLRSFKLPNKASTTPTN